MKTEIINATLEGQYIKIKKEGNLLPVYSIQNGNIEIEDVYTDDLEDLVNVVTIAQSLKDTQSNVKNGTILIRLKTDLVDMEQTSEGLWSILIANNELGLHDEELDEMVELGQAMLNLA